MTQEIDPPLGPPPRKAHYRRGIRNVRRPYRTVFALIVLVFGGWAALDAIQYQMQVGGDETMRSHLLYLGIGHCLVALLTYFVLRYVEGPLRRELRLARRGEVAPGQLLALRPAKRKRAATTIAYTFRTAGGATLEGTCPLPRRLPIADLTPGMTIDVLFDPLDPRRNKPRLALQYVEFGDRKKTGPAASP